MDKRTVTTINTLDPRAQPWARAHFDAIASSGLVTPGHSVRFVSGHRSWPEQDRLFAQGRTAPGQIVTNARGGQSSHNFGIAWDIGVFDRGGKYLGASPLYEALGPIGEEIGLEWGGRWRSFRDMPHYQVRTGLPLSALRALVRRGQPIPVPAFGEAAEVWRGNTVTIVDGATDTDVPAYIDAGRVWVAVRPFVNRFGGEVLAVGDASFTLELHDQAVTVPGTVRDGVGFARFADLNRVLGWAFRYEDRRLTVYTEER